MLLISLILAHLIGDFYLQKEAWVNDRLSQHWRSVGLLKHVGVHALLLVVVFLSLILLNELRISVNILPAFLFILVTHYIIDVIKSYFRPSWLSLLLDQLAHLSVLIVVYLFIVGGWDTTMESLVSLANVATLKLVAIYLIAAKPASFLIAAVLQNQTEELKADQNSQGLAEAGRMIGYLERWLVITFVLIDQFIGIGFLLAAKSIFRFGDLKQPHERRLTEYMLLGTLWSFSIGLLLGSILI